MAAPDLQTTKREKGPTIITYNIGSQGLRAENQQSPVPPQFAREKNQKNDNQQIGKAQK